MLSNWAELHAITEQQGLWQLWTTLTDRLGANHALLYLLFYPLCPMSLS